MLRGATSNVRAALRTSIFSEVDQLTLFPFNIGRLTNVSNENLVSKVVDKRNDQTEQEADDADDAKHLRVTVLAIAVRVEEGNVCFGFDRVCCTICIVPLWMRN